MTSIPMENCCGCTACYNACPVAAIEMKPDKEGFLFPELNKAKCVECGLCEKVCPLLNPPKINERYEGSIVAQHEKKEVLRESTSGGFIDALCEAAILCKNGYVAGVMYDECFMPVHKITNQLTDLAQFRNSKYAQSELGNSFSQIRDLLENKKFVLFIGTPCQVAGLKSYLQKDYSQLVTVDLVCRSIPSPKLWKMYLDWQKKRYKGNIKYVICRKKTYGYHSGTLEIVFDNGRRYRGSNRVDYFMKSFHSNICSRQSCYDCHFKTKHRCSDFTVFDSWNPQGVTNVLQKDNDCGYSNVIIHTQRGMECLEHVQNVKQYPAEAEKMFSYTGGMESQSVKKKTERDSFYEDLEQFSFEQTMKKYVQVSTVDRLIETLKPLRYCLKRMRR